MLVERVTFPYIIVNLPQCSWLNVKLNVFFDLASGCSHIDSRTSVITSDRALSELISRAQCNTCTGAIHGTYIATLEMGRKYLI
jgi:hypothetical protein